MYEQVKKDKDIKRRRVANSIAQKKSSDKKSFEFVDNRPVSVAQLKRTLQDNRSRTLPIKDTIDNKDFGSRGIQRVRTDVNMVAPEQGMSHGYLSREISILKKATTTKVGVANDMKGRDPVVIKGEDYGLTWPQNIEFRIGAKKTGDDWEPVLQEVIGSYSKQAVLLAGQTDVTSADQATNAVQATEILTSFDQFGEGAHSWYSLKAVDAHESVHARSIMTALPKIEQEIKQSLESETVPIAGAVDEGTAVTQIEALVTYNPKKESAYDLWFAKVITLIGNDHATDGPCELAEKRITDTITAKIKTKQIDQKWLPKPQLINVLA